MRINKEKLEARIANKKLMSHKRERKDSWIKDKKINKVMMIKYMTVQVQKKIEIELKKKRKKGKIFGKPSINLNLRYLKVLRISFKWLYKPRPKPIKKCLSFVKKYFIFLMKNLKKIEELENMRMVQQPYLVSSNTHYRSSINDYPLITIDDTGKKYLHPNHSLKVS